MKANIREDDMLEILGKALRENGFSVFAISGNQQGRFWYNIGVYRKGPDVVAVKNELIIVGEGKLKSRDLFIKKENGFSDYDSIIYLLDHQSAYNQLMEKVRKSCNKIGIELPENAFIKGMVVGGDPFEKSAHFLIDKRVECLYVDIKKEKVTIQK